MGEWLGVRLRDEVRYINLRHVLDVTFARDPAGAQGSEGVIAATIRVAVPGQGLEVITSGGEGAQDLYRQVVGERG